jgi:hypothetical protein
MVALLPCSVLPTIGPRRELIRRIAIRCSSSGLFTYWRNAFHFEHGGPRWHWIEVKTEPIIEVISQLKLFAHGICFDLPITHQR